MTQIPPSSSFDARLFIRSFLSGYPCISPTSPSNLKASTLNAVMIRCRYSYFETLLVPLILEVAELPEADVVFEAGIGVGAGLVVDDSPSVPCEALLSIAPSVPCEALLSIAPSISILLEALSALILFSLHILFIIPLQSLSTRPNSVPAVDKLGTVNCKHALARSNRHCKIWSSESNDR